MDFDKRKRFMDERKGNKGLNGNNNKARKTSALKTENTQSDGNSPTNQFRGRRQTSFMKSIRKFESEFKISATTTVTDAKSATISTRTEMATDTILATCILSLLGCDFEGHLLKYIDSTILTSASLRS